jgi:hypothetical protein
VVLLVGRCHDGVVVLLTRVSAVVLGPVEDL